VLEERHPVAIGDRQMEAPVQAERGERNVVDRPRHLGAADDVDRQRSGEGLSGVRKRLADDGAVAGGRRRAEHGSDGRAVDGKGFLRAVIAGSGLRRAHGQEDRDRSGEGTNDGPHISCNVKLAVNVAVRPMRRADLATLATWGRHEDPLFRHYDTQILGEAETGDLWRFLAGAPHLRRPYAGLAGDRVVASLLVRPLADPAAADLGIILDPAHIGRGLGRRILACVGVVLANDGFRRLQLDVMGYNGRAIAAYRAAGFAVTGERWDEPEPGINVAALLDGPAAERLRPHVRESGGGCRMRVLRMERRLAPYDKD
jgi:diamine N-acetyltransferase